MLQREESSFLAKSWPVPSDLVSLKDVHKNLMLMEVFPVFFVVVVFIFLTVGAKQTAVFSSFQRLL